MKAPLTAEQANGFGAIGVADEGKRIAWACISGGRPALKSPDGGALWLRMDRVDLGLLNGGTAPVLLSHYLSFDNLVGVVERAWTDGMALFATLRFGRTARCDEVWAQVRDGILRNVSVGFVHWGPRDRDDDEDAPAGWRPYEVSLCTIPADWTARIQLGPVPDHVLRHMADDAATKAGGTPASWRAFADVTAPKLEALATHSAQAVAMTFRSAVDAELVRLGHEAAAPFLNLKT